MTGLFDAGLQPERTLLAWRRTCLAFGAASLVAVRFTFEVLGSIAIVTAALGLVLAVVAYGGAGARYRRTNDALAATGQIAEGAIPLAVITMAAALLGIACVLYVTLRGMG